MTTVRDHALKVLAGVEQDNQDRNLGREVRQLLELIQPYGLELHINTADDEETYEISVQPPFTDTVKWCGPRTAMVGLHLGLFLHSVGMPELSTAVERLKTHIARILKTIPRPVNDVEDEDAEDAPEGRDCG